MGMQHVYSRSLAGLLLLAALAALSCGGCGKAVSQECPVLEPIWSAPCLSNSDEVARESDEEMLTISDEPTGDVGQAGVWGYSDPAAEVAMPTTGGNCPDVPRHEADLPSASPDAGTSESGTEPEPGPGP